MLFLFLVFSNVSQKQSMNSITKEPPNEDLSVIYFTEFIEYKFLSFNIILRAFLQEIEKYPEMEKTKDKLEKILILTAEYQDLTLNDNSKLFVIIKSLEAVLNLQETGGLANISHISNFFNHENMIFDDEIFKEGIVDLIDCLKVLIKFDEEQMKQSKNQYESPRSGRKICIALFSYLIRILLCFLYEKEKEKYKLDVFMHINEDLTQKIFLKFSESKKWKFEENLTDKEQFIYKNIHEEEIPKLSKYAFDQVLNINRDLQDEKSFLNTVMREIKVLFTIVIYIINETNIQLRKDQIDLYEIDVSIEELVTKRYNKLIGNNMEKQNIEPVKSKRNNFNKNTEMKLREEILKTCNHTCQNCHGYEIDGFIDQCSLDSLYTLLESMENRLEMNPKIDFFSDYEDVLDLKVYILNFIKDTISKRLLAQNISIKRRNYKIHTLTNEIYEEYVINYTNTSTFRKVEEIENQIKENKQQISKFKEYKLRYRKFIYNLEIKKTRQNQKETIILEYFRTLLIDEANKNLELEESIIFEKFPHIPILSLYLSILWCFYKDFMISEENERLLGYMANITT